MDIDALNDIAQKQVDGRKSIRVLCCQSSGCMSAKARDVKDALVAACEKSSIAADIEIVQVGCMGMCGQGPLVRIEPARRAYRLVTAENAPQIIDALMGGACEVPLLDLNQPFFAKQQKVVLENSGNINPEKIEDYIAAGGYLSLYNVLSDSTPGEVIETMIQSGLRGRGGAGYPTGLKWSTVSKSKGLHKIVVCNADEGDPGAFMDQAVLESDPHRVLEGMAIAAYAVGAEQGYVYIRGEYPLAIRRVQTAIRDARSHGLLGSQIFDSSFDFRVDMRIGGGAFVCGEETALLESIEGQRGAPKPRPPYPAVSGLWGYPTVINNVETYANVPAIIRNGATWFSTIGTEKSKGTKIFALVGKCRYSGLIEVPMGTKLHTIVEEMGGGATDGHHVKAVQTGGPSGGCIPTSLFDTPVDYGSLQQVGSIMGSGGMIVMDEEDDMVGIARYFMEFCMDESCGKCVPCRAGTVQIHRILTRIADGQASSPDVERLHQLCEMVKRTSLCGLGQSAPNPVLSTLRYFESEYLDRLTDRNSGNGNSSEPPSPNAKQVAKAKKEQRHGS